MGKSLYIAEKPSVAQEFAKALHINTKRKGGYLESEETIVTWCVGHLVTMSYPEEYDPALKRWSLETLPFIPQEFKYEVIPAVSKQFRIVSGLLNRADVDTIYVCTDSGREGEYIYRLVEQQAGVKGKNRRCGRNVQRDRQVLAERAARRGGFRHIDLLVAQGDQSGRAAYRARAVGPFPEIRDRICTDLASVQFLSGAGARQRAGRFGQGRARGAVLRRFRLHRVGNRFPLYFQGRKPALYRYVPDRPVL